MKNREKVKEAKWRENEFIAKAVEKDNMEKKRARAGDGDGNAGSSADGGRPGGATEASGSGAEKTEGETKRSRLRSGSRAGEEDQEPDQAGMEGVEADLGPGKRARTDEPGDGEEKRVRVMCIMGMEVNDDVEELPGGGEGEWAVDDLSGKELKAEDVRAARKEEVEFMMKIGLCEEATEQDCWDKTGKAPVGTKWIDVLKQTENGAIVRSRLVARDFKNAGDRNRDDLFAATPPLEVVKAMLSLARRERNEDFKVMLIDVKKAHLNGVVGEDDGEHFVRLPEEMGGGCGKLRRWLYGMRPAARGWEDDYSQRMEDAGMKRGKAASTTYYNAATGTRCVVHGDDFTFMGPSRDLARMRGLMEEWYQIKVRAILGDGPEDDKEITLLNRIVRWRADFVEVQADAKHQRLILECFGLDASSNALASPSVKVDVDRAGDGELEKGRRRISGQ
jgi:hypothetical protein